ncbi:MAG TPA: pyroglutamyl-peptidase I [Opitutaceae bacterium]
MTLRGPSRVRKSKTVLLTGFEPFGGETVNPSALAVRALDGRVISGWRVVAAVLPCAFGGALAVLEKQLRAVRPGLVICVGQAGGRAEISVERVAINVDDARIPDNAGAQPIDRPVVARGPAAYWSTLPIKAIVAALRARGFPAGVSQTAGTFVCNHVFYGAMHLLRRRRGVRAGFIHVPWLPEQAVRVIGGAPSLPLDRVVVGLEIVIATALETRRDLRVSEGQTE